MSTILITGVSTGIGNATARLFRDAGWRVIGTVQGSPAETPEGLDGIEIVTLELAEKDAPTRFAAQVLDRFGCPDVLLNNAGALVFGPIEVIPQERIEWLFRINVFAQIELIQAFAPAMRERGSGTIANVTSLGGRLTFPFFGVYNATKWALEGFSEGLWHELQPFGVRVKAIEPGFVATAIWAKALPPKDAPADGPEAYLPYLEGMRRFESSIADRTPPDKAAQEIFAAVTDDSDRLRYPIAAYARPILAARRILGDQRVMRFFHPRWLGLK